MAFPSVAGTPTLTQVTSANPAAISMPSGIVAGELLLVFCAGDTSGTMSESGGSSWTILDQGANGSAVQGAIFAKIAEGSDTLSVTFEANDFAAVAVRIQNHGVSNVSSDITKGTAATGSDATPNPPACSPSTAKDYLWLEFFAADDDDATANYESSGWTKVGQAESADSSSSCMCAVASYELNDNTLNPAAMAMAATEEWRTQTLAIPPAAITKATVGPNGAGTGADDSAVGTLAWSNPTRITALDHSRASAGFTGSGLTTHYLKGTNFGFSIPTGATIVGIKLEIAKNCSADYPGVVDSTVKLVKGGSVVGSNRAAAGAWTTVNDTIYAYGGETDKWGTTWTPAEINSSDFGAVLSAYKADSWGNANVDYFRITVYFALNITLTISEATHSHSAENAVLVENKTLVVPECAHAHSVENVALTENKTLAVAEASHAHGVDGDFALVENKVLTVPDGTHAHTADGDLVLTEHSTTVELIVGESTHAHGAENVALVENKTLEVAEDGHAHAADNIDLTQVHALAVEECGHAHSSDNAVLTQGHNLEVAGDSLSHSVDNTDLSQAHNLAVQSSNHGHLADLVKLVEHYILEFDEATHAHFADGDLALTQQHNLLVDDSILPHAADSVDLTEHKILVISESLHDHAADLIALVFHSTLVGVGGSLHSHTADLINLIQSNLLQVQDALHAHSAESLTLGNYLLIVNSARHGMKSDSVNLMRKIIPRPKREAYFLGESFYAPDLPDGRLVTKKVKRADQFLQGAPIDGLEGETDNIGGRDTWPIT